MTRVLFETRTVRLTLWRPGKVTLFLWILRRYTVALNFEFTDLTKEVE